MAACLVIWFVIDLEYKRTVKNTIVSEGTIIDMDISVSEGHAYIYISLDEGTIVYGNLVKYGYVKVGDKIVVSHHRHKIRSLEVIP